MPQCPPPPRAPPSPVLLKASTARALAPNRPPPPATAPRPSPARVPAARRGPGSPSPRRYRAGRGQARSGPRAQLLSARDWLRIPWVGPGERAAAPRPLFAKGFSPPGAVAAGGAGTGLARSLARLAGWRGTGSPHLSRQHPFSASHSLRSRGPPVPAGGWTPEERCAWGRSPC